MLGIVSEDENQNKIFKPMAGATLGQGVPLGTWCSFEKDVAPSSNWLVAGSSISSAYPALALYLGTNQVPYRYDHDRPSEKMPIDGTGTIQFTLSTTNSEVPYDGILNFGHSDAVRTVYVNDVLRARSSNGTTTIEVKKGDQVRINDPINSTSFYYAIWYTHPLFIKATSIASDTDQQAILAQIQAYNTYSTEETLTGKTWIDGKPIYRKCYAGNLADNQLLVDNVSEQIGCGGIFYDSADNTNPFPYYSTTYSISCGVKANTTKIVGYTSGSSRNVKIWIEYTKTTD